MGDYAVAFSTGGSIENLDIYGKDIRVLIGRVICSITMYTFLRLIIVGLVNPELVLVWREM